MDIVKLKQIAEEYALKQWEGQLPWSVIQKAYYDGYRDCQKKLEKENAELLCQKNRNKSCYSCANATERCFRNEIGCPCQKYKSYKEENAELEKAYNETEELLDKQIEATYNVVEENKEAKEIIQDLLIVYQQFNQTDTYIRAEQFLKECE